MGQARAGREIAGHPQNYGGSCPGACDLGKCKWASAGRPGYRQVELDDPSRQVQISETDFLSVGEAPGYDDMKKK